MLFVIFSILYQYRLYDDEEKPASFRLFAPIGEHKRGNNKGDDKSKQHPVSPVLSQTHDSLIQKDDKPNPMQLCTAPCALINENTKTDEQSTFPIKQ